MREIHFAENVRYLMQREGLTQHELANATGISRSAIAGFVTNRKECSFKYLIALSDYFNVPIDIILCSPDIDKDIKKHDKKELMYEMIREKTR